MNITIKTNNAPRDLLSWHELPEKFQREMDYVEGEDRYSLRFFLYRDWVYDANEFMAVSTLLLSDTAKAFEGWDGYQSDSFFSGVLVRYVENYERVVVGTYFS